MVTMASAKVALARFTKDSIASEISPIEFEKNENLHSSLADAISQTNHLLKILRA